VNSKANLCFFVYGMAKFNIHYNSSHNGTKKVLEKLKAHNISVRVCLKNQSLVDPASHAWIVSEGTTEMEDLLRDFAELKEFIKNSKTNGIPDFPFNKTIESDGVDVDPNRRNMQVSYGLTGGESTTNRGISEKSSGNAYPAAHKGTDEYVAMFLLFSKLRRKFGCRYVEACLRHDLLEKDSNLDNRVACFPSRVLHPAESQVRDCTREELALARDLDGGHMFQNKELRNSAIVGGLGLTHAVSVSKVWRLDGAAITKEEMTQVNAELTRNHSDRKNSPLFPEIFVIGSVYKSTYMNGAGVQYGLLLRNAFISYERKSADDSIALDAKFRPIIAPVAAWFKKLAADPIESFRLAKDPSEYLEKCGHNRMAIRYDVKTGE